ncbi:hypothetical protein BH24ACT26_BH24ACT26_22300 [soil metagenome]
MRRNGPEGPGFDLEEHQPKLYADLATWFHLLTPPEEYSEEAQLYRRVLTEAAAGPVERVLELGSGGGNNASHMKDHFEMTLVDISHQMLEQSRSINPECEHAVGDMRSVRLGREFDAVFVHDAVDYITNESDLRAAIATAFIHCRPGGVALFVPDYVRETFRSRTEHGGRDGERRALRYLMWEWDPDPADTTYYEEFAYLLRDETGAVRVEHDRHVCGVFERGTWLRLLAEVGFQPEVRPADYDDETGTELFVASKRH